MKYNWNQFETHMESLLNAAKIPGAQVVVRDETGIVYQQCFGFRNADRTLPVDNETVFGIASMSKSITCLAAALLEQEGKLSYDDPVSRYIPDFRIPGTPTESILVRHLANHTTGLPPLPTLCWSMKTNTPDDPWEVEFGERVRREAEYKVDKVQDIIDYIAAGKGYKTLGQPGEYMSYLNDGYALLSTVIDVASGETLESYVDRKIFEPLGMTRTTFSLEKMLAAGNCTSLFYYWENEMRCSDIWDIAQPYRGCGWVKSTAADMSRYYQMLSQNGVFEGRQIVPAACVERMIGREFPEKRKSHYCFGLSKRLFENVAICEHSGGLKGVSSRGGFIKDGSFSAVVLTNLTGIDIGPMLNTAFNLRLGQPVNASHAWYAPAEGYPEVPEMYVGSYFSKEDPDVVVHIELGEDGKLIWKEFGNTLEMVYAGTTVFLLIPKGKTVKEGIPRTFFARDGKMWGIEVGSRIFQRVEE